MTVTEQRYEGEYRYVNSRLITNRLTRQQLLKLYNVKLREHLTHFFFLFSEEIAFYNGNLREKQTIHATFKKLVGNSSVLCPIRWEYVLIKEVLLHNFSNFCITPN